jgi:hypothetical protein
VVAAELGVNTLEGGVTVGLGLLDTVQRNRVSVLVMKPGVVDRGREKSRKPWVVPNNCPNMVHFEMQYSNPTARLRLSTPPPEGCRLAMEYSDVGGVLVFKGGYAPVTVSLLAGVVLGGVLGLCKVQTRSVTGIFSTGDSVEARQYRVKRTGHLDGCGR